MTCMFSLALVGGRQPLALPWLADHAAALQLRMCCVVCACSITAFGQGKLDLRMCCSWQRLQYTHIHIYLPAFLLGVQYLTGLQSMSPDVAEQWRTHKRRVLSCGSIAGAARHLPALLGGHPFAAVASGAPPLEDGGQVRGTLHD